MFLNRICLIRNVHGDYEHNNDENKVRDRHFHRIDNFKLLQSGIYRLIQENKKIIIFDVALKPHK